MRFQSRFQPHSSQLQSINKNSYANTKAKAILKNNTKLEVSQYQTSRLNYRATNCNQNSNGIV